MDVLEISWCRTWQRIMSLRGWYIKREFFYLLSCLLNDERSVLIKCLFKIRHVCVVCCFSTWGVRSDASILGERDCTIETRACERDDDVTRWWTTCEYCTLYVNLFKQHKSYLMLIRCRYQIEKEKIFENI